MSMYAPKHLATRTYNKKNKNKRNSHSKQSLSSPQNPKINKKIRVTAGIIASAIQKKTKENKIGKKAEHFKRKPDQKNKDEHDIEETNNDFGYSPKPSGYIPKIRLVDTLSTENKEKKQENEEISNKPKLENKIIIRNSDENADDLRCKAKPIGYVPKVDFDDESVCEEKEINGEETENDRKKELFLYVQTVLEAIVSAFLILTFFVSVSVVIGSSMEPTLVENDRLVIMKSFYKPEYGDIIAVWAEGLPNRETGETGEMIVKRVIGLEGDVIDIDETTGTVYRNGEPLNEEYIKESINADNLGNADYPLTVAENSVFVLGDNRNHSTDSRYVENAGTDYYVGCIDLRYIMGKAVFRIYPIDRIGVLK